MNSIWCLFSPELLEPLQHCGCKADPVSPIWYPASFSSCALQQKYIQKKMHQWTNVPTVSLTVCTSVCMMYWAFHFHLGTYLLIYYYMLLYQTLVPKCSFSFLFIHGFVSAVKWLGLAPAWPSPTLITTGYLHRTVSYFLFFVAGCFPDSAELSRDAGGCLSK